MVSPPPCSYEGAACRCAPGLWSRLRAPMARILFPLPDRDFDVTESAVPWRLLRDAGHEVVFATEEGAVPAADPLLLTGVLFGQLGALPEPCAFYREMERDPA